MKTKEIKLTFKVRENKQSKQTNNNNIIIEK